MSGRWQLVERAGQTDQLEISTVELSIPHGPEANLHYETAAFFDGGSRVLERYPTKDAAKLGHKKLVDAANGDGLQLEVDE